MNNLAFMSLCEDYIDSVHNFRIIFVAVLIISVIALILKIIKLNKKIKSKVPIIALIISIIPLSITGIILALTLP